MLRLPFSRFFPDRMRVFIAAGIVIIAASSSFVLLYYMPKEREDAVEQWRREISLASNDRGRNLERVVEEAYADAQIIAEYPTTRFLASNEEPPHPSYPRASAEPHLHDLLSESLKLHRMNNIWVLDERGAVLSSARSERTVPAGVIALAIQTAHSGLRGFAQIGTGDQGASHFAVPIRTKQTRNVVGAVVIEVPSKAVLFSLISSPWDVAATSEMLLMERKGDSLRIITPLKKRAAKSFPVSKLTLDEAAALAGHKGFGELTDYAGDRVFAVARPLRNVPWALITKIDRSEALARARNESLSVALALAALLLMIAGAVYAGVVDLRAQHRMQEARDNARQARSDNELRRSYQLLHSITEASGDVIYVKDLDGRFVFINSTGARAVGMAPSAILGKTAVEIRSSNTQVFQTFDDVSDKAAAHTRERLIEDTEHGRSLLSTLSPLLDASGKVTGYVGVARDITEIKQAQQRYDEVNARAHALLEANVVGVVIGTADGRVLEANDYYLELLGYTREELENNELKWIDATPPEHLAKDHRALAELDVDGVSTPYEKEYIRKDGKRIWVLLGDKLLPGPERNILAFVIDISAQKTLEAQYQQAQKMEAVGRLAGGVAHDFNNILTAIKGIAALAIEDCHSSDPMFKDLQDINEFADRATVLTKQLLAFSRRQVLQPRTFNMKNLLDGLNRMLCRLIGEDVELIMIVPDNTLMIHADPGQIEQVILNLAINARDAMPDGGVLRIEADRIALADVPQNLRNGNTAHEMVRLRVSDNGCGMSNDVRERIFEPFFTTKEVNKGTGLGLASVYGIVKQSQGSIDVQSEPGEGTTFTILFPSVSAQITKERFKASVPEPVARRATVLLVEDDDAVRALARRSIERKGYTVFEARNGDEALVLAEANFNELDIVVTDLVMPGMSGREMVRQLREKHGAIKALFMSGYTADVMENIDQLDGAFLEKPFTPPQLCNAIENAVVMAGTLS